ncbi:hypothetical protein AVEN_122522-1 [Araneus ventricosus]|uniref:Uncharacterized protein n=1 Tax=Araneus ventricosus TaxID=182803 RepID=A0A4Y2JXC2_ARAVE|nr:hypothetical protein AVEN_122522-1 [Araneus ventricosus]
MAAAKPNLAYGKGRYFSKVGTQNSSNRHIPFQRGQRYRYVLRYFVIPLLQQHGCLQDVIFLQDGVPSHIDRLVKQLLRHHFTDSRVISSPFPTACPLHSSDIITADFFVGFPEGQYLPQKASISARSEEQHTEPCS